ncbi:MAG: type II secretion system F family protein [Verrucomicrobiae bacterium]|nr:type II secretion system F family protein [Verrucomicrobiae bacterium]
MSPTALVIVWGVFIGVVVFAVLQLTRRRSAIIEERVRTYAALEEEAARSAQAETQQISPIGRLLQLFVGRTYFDRIQDELAQADVPMRPSEYLLTRVVLAAVGALVGWTMFGNPTVAATILAVSGFIGPVFFVRIHQHRRRARFVRQLADALMLLTNSLRSGYSFLKGLELVAKEMSDPISKELQRTLREVNLGATIEEAMKNLGRRVNSRDLDIVISAYLVQKEVGGNLTEIMQKVAETIRERLRIQGDIKVLTAQGRLSGVFVGALPIIVGILIWMSSPDYFNVMFGPPHYVIGGWAVPMGVVLFAAALIWQAIGAYMIWKIISIKV